MNSIVSRTGMFILVVMLSSMVLISGVPRPARGAEPLKGTVRISGAWALYPMMVRWGEEFRKVHPGVRIDISAGGAGKGVADALTGFVDLGMVSRDLRPEETAKGAVFVPVVKDAVFPTMSARNPLADKIMKRGVRKEAFVKLWVGGEPLTWGELAQAGTGGKVQVYTRSDACGAAETWALYLGKKQEDLKGVGIYGDPGVSEAVAKDPNGIGFNNLNFAYDLKTGLPVAGLAVVPIDLDGDGNVDQTEDLSTKERAIRAVASGAYPAPPARDLFLVTKGSFRGLTATFVQWILTDGQKYVDEAGYLKLSAEKLKNAFGQMKP